MSSGCLSPVEFYLHFSILFCFKWENNELWLKCENIYAQNENKMKQNHSILWKGNDACPPNCLEQYCASRIDADTVGVFTLQCCEKWCRAEKNFFFKPTLMLSEYRTWWPQMTTSSPYGKSKPTLNVKKKKSKWIIWKWQIFICKSTKKTGLSLKHRMSSF